MNKLNTHQMQFKLRPNLRHSLKALLIPAALLTIPTGCKDDYVYDDKAPDNLGESIYAELKSRGDFSTMLRLIDDLGYAETLARTGSKTLFPANDKAFEKFFLDNPYGAHSYEELTPGQKRMIMNTAMVNMSYLAEMLSNIAGTDGANPGQAVRRNSAVTYLDDYTRLTESPPVRLPLLGAFPRQGDSACRQRCDARSLHRGADGHSGYDPLRLLRNVSRQAV